MSNPLITLNTLLPLVPLCILGINYTQLIYTYDIKYILFIVFYYLGDLLNYIFKRISHKLLDYELTKRPKNYGTFTVNGDLYDIGTHLIPRIYTKAKLNKPSVTYGFPSGHSQSMITFATFTTLHLLYEKDFDLKDLPKYILPWILAFAVIWQRVFSKCHSVLQVSVGSIVGIIMGYVFFQIFLLFDEL
jgi:membrane-associated phospholipid phosphatase